MESGFVFQGARYEGGVVNGLEYIWTSGGDVIDPNDPEKVVIDVPGAAEGLAIHRAEHGRERRSPQGGVHLRRAGVPGGLLGWARSSAATGHTCTPWRPVRESRGWSLGRSGSRRCRSRRTTARASAAWGMELLPERGLLQRREGPRLRVRRVRDLPGAAEVPGAERLFPADARIPLRRAGDTGKGARHRPGQEGHKERPPAAPLALLLGHVPQDGRAVQRLAEGRKVPEEAIRTLDGKPQEIVDLGETS